MQKIKALLTVGFLAGFLLSSCSPAPAQPAATQGSSTSSPDRLSLATTTAEIQYWPTHEWRASTPEAQGMDSEALSRMFEYIQNEDIRLHSLLIVRNGYLVTEAYWHPYGPNDKHSIESNTKSIIGTLIGIAIDKGHLKSADQKLVDFFTKRTIKALDEGKKSITVKNLLSMTPGLDCQDLSSAGQGLFKSSDWVQYLLDLPMSDPPGTRWIYCSGAAHLLSAILQVVTGMDARTYANTNLFQPLGIPAGPEADWNTDPQGITNGVAGLYLTPRDLAKYGYLYLKRGNWDGKQVVPAAWVEESTREQAYIGPDDYVGGLDRRFGYMWSIFPDQKYFGYLGMAGQELFVLPEKDMVIVFTGSLPVGKEAVLLKLVNDHILPSVYSDAPLPENPQAYSKLEALIGAAPGSAQRVQPLPEKALEITGKTYLLDQNPLGWKDMTFTFQPDADTATLSMSTSPDLKIGLDERYRLTETPGSRPVGLRGRWLTPDEFELDDITLGEFIESVGRFKFEGSQMTLSISNLNYGGTPITLTGRIKE